MNIEEAKAKLAIARQNHAAARSAIVKCADDISYLEGFLAGASAGSESKSSEVKRSKPTRKKPETISK